MSLFRCQSLAVALALLPLSALAADPMTDAIQTAYAPYRVALFKTNGKSLPESRDAVLLARAQWAEVSLRFAGQPPVPYVSDGKLMADFVRVDAIYVQAATEIEQGQLAKAHDTLEEVRDILARLRWRNGVVVFSDHMNAYHSEMERVLDESDKLLAQANGRFHLMAQAGVLGYLAKRLETEATPALAANAEFVELVKAVRKSVADVEAALISGETALAKQALGGLKKPYSRLFIKFG
jgi:hypothetical protein